MMAFCREHPKWDQNPKFTPLSEPPPPHAPGVSPGYSFERKYIINDFLGLHLPPTNCIYLAARNLRGSPTQVLGHSLTLKTIDPFKLFLTTDIDQLAKNPLTPLKRRLNNSRIATFESYLLKKDKHITVQLGRFNNVTALFSMVSTN